MPITPELMQYIAQARASGMSDDAIRTELLKVGWNITDVNSAIPPKVPSFTPPKAAEPSQAWQAGPQVTLGQFQGGPVSEARYQIQPRIQSQPQPQLQQQPQMATSVPPKRHGHAGFVVTVILLLLIGGAVYYFLPQIITLYDQLMNKSSLPVTEQPIQQESVKSNFYTIQELNASFTSSDVPYTGQLSTEGYVLFFGMCDENIPQPCFDKVYVSEDNQVNRDASGKLIDLGGKAVFLTTSQDPTYLGFEVGKRYKLIVEGMASDPSSTNSAMTFRLISFMDADSSDGGDISI